MSHRVNRWAAAIPVIIAGLALAIFSYVEWHSSEPWLWPPTVLGPYPVLYVVIGIACSIAAILLYKWVGERTKLRDWISFVILLIPVWLFGSFSDMLMMMDLGIYLAMLGLALFVGIIDTESAKKKQSILKNGSGAGGGSR